MGAGLRDIAPKEVYSALIDAAAGTGDVVVVAATSGKKIVVINFLYTSSAAQTTTFQSDPDGGDITDLTGDMLVFANGWVKGHYNPDGHFKTIAGERLLIERGGSTALGGWLNYYLE